MAPIGLRLALRHVYAISHALSLFSLRSPDVRTLLHVIGRGQDGWDIGQAPVAVLRSCGPALLSHSRMWSPRLPKWARSRPQLRSNGVVADGTRADGRVGGGLRATLKQLLERFGSNGLGDAPESIPNHSEAPPEFPSHTHTPHSLSRQHSFQHISEYGHGGMSTSRYDSAAAMATPLPPSPGPMDVFEDAQGRKRQRTGPGVDDGGGGMGSKKGSRARSDSAPLGYGLASGWPQTRPRSGSGLQNRVAVGRREEQLPIPNIGSLSRGQTLPMLSIPGVPKQSQSSS
ncbi:hypothetical protein PHLGIDRAFT_131087 [Phlebiopsis gigantea 11061_1 CR5-6]|uniref:Uncharacterized protein n=1 Tax=Phlebiopsis gigantea (strain 11061_1 CR5-6) TaxID=745531 RepID=A0A0C3RQ69_PHLG1|nr:hypothetical protein PHLGIDRAFT_131087 [Phlebiopsis gigantea 11061_1 CR5-6]